MADEVMESFVDKIVNMAERDGVPYRINMKNNGVLLNMGEWYCFTCISGIEGGSLGAGLEMPAKSRYDNAIANLKRANGDAS